ncbi:MAG: glycosyltransferase family 4 protein [Gammaproteobacteria bacterium]|nr:glycosyltransferase family 4 protein [Gammaproteobacteria bacterium]MDE2346132.1 glycosyltransferase family 4 protein [Gammaproteobacteria bacterium]
MPRLLMFENNPAYFLSHRLALAKSLAGLGYDVHVATLPGDAVKGIQAAGFMHHAIKFSRSGINPLSEFAALVRIARLYSRIKPDIVYQVTVKPVIYGTLAARYMRVPGVVSVISGLGFVATGSGRMISYLRSAVLLFYRFALRHSHQCIIFHNRDDQEIFIRRGIAVRVHTRVVPGSGVDTQYFTPSPEVSGVPVVLLPARMLRDKGIYEFVAAATRLRSSGVQARFLLAGSLDPDNPGAIPETQLRQWNSEANIEWLGQVIDMRSLYSNAHVVCLPSYREGIPRVLLEAAACSRPVITTDVPGCRDAVQAGETGLLVPARDVEKLVAAIKRLIDDPGLRLRMGQRGRLLSERQFSTVRVTADAVAVVQELASRMPSLL